MSFCEFLLEFIGVYGNLWKFILLWNIIHAFIGSSDLSVNQIESIVIFILFFGVDKNLCYAINCVEIRCFALTVKFFYCFFKFIN